MHVFHNKTMMIHKSESWPGPAVCGTDLPFMTSSVTLSALSCPRCLAMSHTLERQLKIRVTEKDFQRLQNAARDQELSLSGYIRERLDCGDDHV